MPLINEDYKCTLSEKYLEQAKKELNEDPNTRLEYCQKLLDAVEESNPEIHVNPDPKFLLRFLRARKFDLERARTLLVRYYSMRYEEEAYKNITPNCIKHVLEAQMGGVLPKRDKQGRIVNVFNPGLWDFEKYEAADVLKTNLVILEMLVMDENTQVSGIASIGNFKDYSLSQFLHFAPISSKMGNLFDGAFPIRMKGMRMINPPKIISKILELIQKMMSKKMVERTKVITSTSFQDELIEEFGEECLPVELGGKESSNYMEWTNEKLYALEDYMKDQLKYGISTTGSYKIVDNM